MSNKVSTREIEEAMLDEEMLKEEVAEITEETEVTEPVEKPETLTDKIVEASNEIELENPMQNGISQVVMEELDETLDAEDEADEIEKKNKILKNKMRAKKIGILVLIGIILILLLKSCSGDIVEKLKPILEDSEYIEQDSGHPDHVDGTTAIPVVDDFTVSKSKPYVNLYNPEVNQGYSYLQYRFTDIHSGDVIYESKLVEPGKKFSVAIGDMLEIGEYDVLVEILNFDYNDFETRKNGAQSEITITVVE